MTLAPIFSLLIILVLSLLVTRVATVALTFTGLAQESARFQARSAFTGVGFTSKESENVLNHPVRRRIIMLLMLSGNVGIVTVVASLVLTLGDIVGSGPWLPQLALLAAGIGLLTLIATSRWVNHRLSSLIAWALRQWTTIDVHDYAKLLHLCGEYGVVETPVGEGKWLADTTLGKLSLGEEGVLVLGVQRRDGGYVGVPTSETRIVPGDILTLYGRTPRLAKIDVRRNDVDGDRCRAEGIAEQQRMFAEQPI